MKAFRSSGLLRFGAAAGLVLLAGCAGQQTGSAPPTPAVTQAASPVGQQGWMDGDYQGNRSPDGGNPDCGFESAVGYDVSGASIRLRTHKQSRALAGKIDSTGHFALLDANGEPQVVGVIAGDRLTAIETRPPHHHRHFGNALLQSGACTARIEAGRVAQTP